MKSNKTVLAALLGTLFVAPAAFAEMDSHTGHHGHMKMMMHAPAPTGVMGSHTHKQGKWMFSYRFMSMHMDGNQSGSSNISPEEIATTIPNRLAGQPGQPPTLRVVPTEMTTDMHMLGAMYAPTDNFTFMVMANYLKKEMDHITFQGATGTTRLGKFTTKSEGIGDTRVSGLLKIYDHDRHKVHLNLGVSLPTGSITKKDNVLTPMGARPKLRMPYPMQLGSGTYDLLPGVTYQTHRGKWGFGGQYMATIRLGENSKDYTLGDEHKLTGWTSYKWGHNINTSIRLSYLNVDNIDGADPQVRAPVQTADPDNHGKERVDLHAGINWSSHTGHRLALEVGAPIYQHLDGTQLELDWTLTAGYQYMF